MGKQPVVKEKDFALWKLEDVGRVHGMTENCREQQSWEETFL